MSVDGEEKEEGANGLGPLAGSEDAAGAAALVVDADAVDDSRRGHLESTVVSGISWRSFTG